MKNNDLNSIVSISPHVRDGKPCFKNSRIPVEYVLEHFAKGWNIDEISELFPEIKKSNVSKVLHYLSGAMSNSNDDKKIHAWPIGSR